MMRSTQVWVLWNTSHNKGAQRLVEACLWCAGKWVYLTLDFLTLLVAIWIWFSVGDTLFSNVINLSTTHNNKHNNQIHVYLFSKRKKRNTLVSLLGGYLTSNELGQWCQSLHSHDAAYEGTNWFQTGFQATINSCVMILELIQVDYM